MFRDERRAINAGLFHDLPVGILADHLAVAKRVEVAAADFLLVPSRVVPVSVHSTCRAGGRIDEMLAVAVVDVGQALKASGERFRRSACPRNEPRACLPAASPDAIVGKERHDAIEVMRVEGFA